MPSIDQELTVGQLVCEHPSRSKVFEKLKIDYCCGGKVSLKDACRKRQLDLDEVLGKLHSSDQEAVAGTSDGTAVDANTMSLTELTEHIEQSHHAYLKEELPRLDRMTEKVARVHGDREPRLHQIRQAFMGLQGELEPHMMKEERVLFPMVRELEASSTLPNFHCGSISNPIGQMEHEHDNAGEALAEIRELTDQFQPPDWACNTYRAMFDALHRLEQDLHEHVHKENNVLFPKALDLERQRVEV